MRYFKISISFVVIFFCNLARAHAHREVVKELYRINALTVRQMKNPPIGITASSIEQLVRTIYLHNAVPHHTLLSINDTYFMVYRGLELLPSDRKVFIFSRGYAKTTEPGTNEDFIQRGAAAKSAYIQLQDNIIPPDYPLISFDYDDGRYGFAFGQQREIRTLQTVYDAVLHSNPDIEVVLIGDCRGAKVALEIAANRPANLRALILMAPFVSGRHITDRIAAQHLSYLPAHKDILHNFFKLYFKTYKESLDTLHQRLSHIDPRLPIFIGHRIYDELISTDSIHQLIEHLRQTGNKTIHLATTEDRSEPHSKMTEMAEIQHGIAQFIQKYVFQDAVQN